MQCEVHGCILESNSAVVNGLGGTLMCPACEAIQEDCLLRDKLGFPTKYSIVSSDGSKLNIINGKCTPTCIGDQELHAEHGKGIVVFISENSLSKYPIKMHFPEKNVYCYFNIEGMQYKNQDTPLIQFPYYREQKEVRGLFTESGKKVTKAGTTIAKLFSGESIDADKWDYRFMDLAKQVSTWSKDPSTQVGAVITDVHNRVVSMGFNGYPRNIPDDSSLLDREVKYLKVLHGEVNAILFAKRDLENCSIYVWPLPPCTRCSSMIIQSGIWRVVTKHPTGQLAERWEKEIKIAEEMFAEADVELVYV